jgi:hypothetical protein
MTESERKFEEVQRLRVSYLLNVRQFADYGREKKGQRRRLLKATKIVSMSIMLNWRG